MAHQDEYALLHAFFGDSPHGIFVDVGANDPFQGSTSWPLEQVGWSGILIEPIPHLAKRLTESRTSRVFNCACSSRENASKTKTLHVHSVNPGWSSFHKDESPWLGDDFQEIQVDVRTLDEVLEEAEIPAGFDLLAMDVEFHEVSVLEGLDLARWKPRLIFVEDHAYDHNLLRYLRSHDYKFFKRSCMNSWFVPSDSPLTPSFSDRWAFFRKYYLGFPFRRLKRRLAPLRRAFREWRK